MIKEKIKEVLKKENTTWEKLAMLDGGHAKGSYRQTIITRAEKLQKTFDLLGYELTFKKIKSS